MFSAARWRLTLWITIAIGLILVVIGGAVYLTARTVLFDQVNSDLESRAGREQALLATRLLGRRGDDPLADIVIGPAFTSGGYFYALVSPNGELLAATANVDPAGLAGAGAIQGALAGGEAFTDTESSEEDSLRVYVVRLQGPHGSRLLMEVGRSTEPERQALRRLLLVLTGGVVGGLALALAGGYFLAGLALRPIRAAVDSQRAFIADASHELRTPLSVMRANGELLKRHLS
ncbi:MAG TPA: histidine kinase dimerization/phospho-acceptor domain-containing protein, partial [Dehalococcoidia bacterium]|nr:histidine kinase dimerization/phospho-acceptor domain-containing protein [Dehalococcoidia bacterium]